MELFDSLTDKFKSLADKVNSETERLTLNSTKNISEIWQSASQSTIETCNSIADTAREAWNCKIPSKEEIATWIEGSYNYITSLSKDFDTDKMWEKISTTASKAGQDLIVMVLTIYYTISESIQHKNEQEQ